jgi:hypothetical protein
MTYRINRPWYAKSKFIRRKQNHAWTGLEIKKVLDLRIKRVPVDEIIHQLGVKDIKKTQVYNIIRMKKKNRNGKCFQCGNDLTPNEIKNQANKTYKCCALCQEKSLQYKQKIRKENYKKGLCTCCGKKQHLKGKKTCIYCLSYTLRNRIAKGLCGTCGEKPLSPHSLVSCKDCLKGHRKEVSYANC